MSFIDLHVHTNASDGTWTPTEVVEEAMRKNLSVLAITDHDTTKGIREAMEAAKGQEIIIVPGTEISCFYSGREIHMLGLFLDIESEKLEEHLSQMRENRTERNHRMIDRMREAGIPVTMEQLQFGKPDTVITRAHFARYLVEEGYVKTKDEAFQKYLGIGRPFYLPRTYVDPSTAIQWIHEANGLAFLAHPYLYDLKEAKVRQMIVELKELGLDGLEAYHSSTDQGRTNQLRTYAKEWGLLVSGGSDFHGANKPYVHLGVGKGNLRITDHVYEKIKNRQV